MKALLIFLLASAPLMAADVVAEKPGKGVHFTAETFSSNGSVKLGGQQLDYSAVAGTLIVHPKGWDDAATAGVNPEAEAAVFYVAYFKRGAPSPERPLLFLYNGGPGSSTMWLHMGSFGPRRVVTADAAHTSAPYKVVDNVYSLLDVTDVVFVDAPGTGFGQVWGKDQDKGFYGIDADAHAFGDFITAFLSKFGRWKSPKYIGGESYGTPRSAVLSNLLANEYHVDVNGVIMLSQILNYDLGMGASEFNPGTDQPYIVALPAYAAAAWYHKLLAKPQPEDLPAFLRKVEHFAITDYAMALQEGSTLSPQRRAEIAQRMSEFTSLPADYISKSDLRLDARQVRKMLRDDEGLSIGDIDGRFVGPHSDPLAKGAQNDPVMSSIGSAYFAALNDHVRRTLGYDPDRLYKVSANLLPIWEWERPQPANAPTLVFGIANVMPDLAAAMKNNPELKVMVNGGYFDLSTPYYESWYEMHHLPIPASLQDNIEYHYYQSGHMTFIHEPSLKEMRDNIAAFIRKTNELSR